MCTSESNHCYHLDLPCSYCWLHPDLDLQLIDLKWEAASAGRREPATSPCSPGHTDLPLLGVGPCLILSGTSSAQQTRNPDKEWWVFSEFSSLNQLYHGQMNGTGSGVHPGSGEWDHARGAVITGLVLLKTWWVSSPNSWWLSCMHYNDVCHSNNYFWSFWDFVSERFFFSLSHCRLVLYKHKSHRLSQNPNNTTEVHWGRDTAWLVMLYCHHSRKLLNEGKGPTALESTSWLLLQKQADKCPSQELVSTSQPQGTS